MIKYLHALFFTFFTISFPLAAQEMQHEQCGTMTNHSHMIEKHPKILRHGELKERKIQEWIAEHGDNFQNRATYTIPIVFHVVYNTNSQNIDNSYIMAQLSQLNQDFQATNTDYGSVPSVFPKGNMGIEFCLATVDPNGNATTGITRTPTNMTAFTVNGNEVKSSATGGVNAWDTNKYFNVWICPMQSGVLGYAQFPNAYAQSPHTDGLVLGYGTVGSLTTPNPLGYPYNKGRTATHELGHCFGLYHIWGDDNGACTGSDLVEDTPNQADKSSGCPSYPTVSCGSTDMTMNYMDYSNDDCLSAFTVGQAQRVAAVISNYQYLQNKIAAAGTVCNATAPALQAGINPSTTSGCNPLIVNFANTSSSNATNWIWAFPGGNPSGFVGQSPPPVTYSTSGTHTATLTVSNASETAQASVNINVQDCGDYNCGTVNNMNNADIVLLQNTTSGSGSGGYICGHNGYNDKAKAEYFTNIGATTKLNGIEFEFGYATGAGNVEFVIWKDDNGKPGAELKTQSIPVSSIISHVNAGQRTMVDFGGLQDIPTSFFAGIKLGSTNQVALKSNSSGETNPTTAWEVRSDNVWQSFNDGTNATWQIDISMSIHPNLCVLTAVEDIKGLNSMTLEPNPVTDILGVHLNTTQSMNLQIEVYNAIGKRVLDTRNIRANGDTIEKIDVSYLSSGMYFVRISDGVHTATDRFLKF